MKNILKYKICFAVALLGLLSSCTEEDSADNGRLDKPVVTVSQTSFDVTEGDDVSITLTADRALTVPMTFKLELLPDSTGSFRDYIVTEADVDGTPIDETDITVGAGTIGHLITMPAYATTYTFTIKPIVDLKTESNETFHFRFYSAYDSAGLTAPGSDDIVMNVANGTSNDFIVEMYWNGDMADAFGTIHPTEYIGADGDPHEMCDFDFDIEIYDAGFNPQYVDYNNCPAITGIPADAPDGDYIIVPSFWDNQIAAAAVPESGEIVFPVMVTMGKPGVFEHTVDLTGSFLYSAGGANDGNPDAYIPIAVVTKTGTTYVLKDYNDPTIILGQGRFASLMNILRNKTSKN